MERDRIPALDGLRGIAVLMVIGFHHGDRMTGTLGTALGPIISFGGLGWAGVDLFFVLSGFLITGILIRTRGRADYLSAFYTRRTLRIFPLYYATLVAVFFVLPALGVVTWQLSGQDQAWFWTYLANWYIPDPTAPSPGGLSIFWSLAVEEQFYLVWPAVVMLTPTRWLPRAIGTLFLASAVSRVILVVSGVLTPIETYMFTITRLDGLAAGALLATLLARGESPSRAHYRNLLIVSAAVVILVRLAQGTWRELAPLTAPLVFPAVAIMFASMLGLAIGLGEAHRWPRFLAHPILRFFGRYSYALYVFHVLVLFAVAEILPNRLGENWFAADLARFGLTALVMSVSVSITLSVLSWHLFERHFLALKDRLFPHQLAQPVAPASGSASKTAA